MPIARKNLYTCTHCGQQIITLDIDEGTTPFMTLCHVTKGCAGMMRSSMYSVDMRRPHQYEFFKPEDLTAYEGDENTEAQLEHFRKGGLDMRRRVVRSSVIETDILQYLRSLDAIRIVDLQRKFRQTYMTASNLMDKIVSNGVVFPDRDSKGAFIVVQEVPWKGDRSS